MRLDCARRNRWLIPDPSCSEMKPFLIAMSLLTFLGITSAEALPVGAAAPELEAVDQDGQKLNLADQYRKGLVLVYFYPKADTPGCTAQACSLRDAYADLLTEGVDP